MAKAQKAKGGNGGTLGIEADLWRMADKLRGNMDASEYKRVAPGARSNGAEDVLGGLPAKWRGHKKRRRPEAASARGY